MRGYGNALNGERFRTEAVILNFILEHLDYFAMSLLLVGYFRMSNFHRDGWLFTMAGSLALIIFGGWIESSALGIAIGNVIFLIITTRGYLKWKPMIKKG